jgi:hypothetical protein
MNNLIRTHLELKKDEDFFYVSLNRNNVKVIRIAMNREITVEVGIVYSFSQIYVKVNGCFFLRNENKFIVEPV